MHLSTSWVGGGGGGGGGGEGTEKEVTSSVVVALLTRVAVTSCLELETGSVLMQMCRVMHRN